MFAPVGLNALTNGTMTIYRVPRPESGQENTPAPLSESYCGTAVVEDEPVAEEDQDDLDDPEDEPGVSFDTVDKVLKGLEESKDPSIKVAKEDETIPVRDCDKVTLNYSMAVVARAIHYGERLTDVRGLGYGVMKRLRVMMHWQLRWTCNLFVKTESMLKNGSVPWTMGKGIFKLWTLDRLYHWPSIREINGRTQCNQETNGTGMREAVAIVAQLIRDHIVKKVEDLVARDPESWGNIVVRAFKSEGPILGKSSRPIVVQITDIYDDYEADLQDLYLTVFRTLFGTDNVNVAPFRS